MTDSHDILKAAYFTLGCKLNFAETSTIGKILVQNGVVRALETDTPDICIINTCSVTETADKKGRQLIRRITSRWPDAAIVVTGCYAQLKPEEVSAIPGVDIVLGSDEKLRAGEFISDWMKSRKKRICVLPSKDIKFFAPSCERGDRTRYFLKVQDGCDYFCSYCTIPFARGRSRSGTISELVEQARTVAADGGREIVLTGVNVGDFGSGRNDNFFDLIRALDEVEGIERFRISSIEPNLLSEDIIRWVATESRAFMPHFHIPLQSGSDAGLRLMRRRYDTSLFRSRIEKIKELMPHAFIGVDVIAGARGENEKEWDMSVGFIESLPVTQLHVFPYSERPGTQALNIDGTVEQEEKHRRVHILTQISERKYHQFALSMHGTIRKVLWEQPKHGMPMHGFTDNYLRVESVCQPNLINQVTKARIDCKNSDSGIIAEIIP